MQYQETIFLSDETLDNLLANSKDKEEMVYKDLNKNSEKIAQLLTSYHYSKQEGVHSIEIEKSSLKIGQKGTGSFLVHYIIDFFNGCADLNFNVSEKMQIGLEVSFATSTATITGEFFAEREMDEL